jgi:endonuclease/exonuclease/phosphatase (EEP) superfamily protein YafD
MTSSDDSNPRSVRSALARIFWRVGCVGCRVLLLVALVIAAMSPTLADRDWRFDLVASLLAQVTLAGLVLTGWQLAFRRWIWGSVFLIVSIAGGSWILRVERAEWATEMASAGDRRSIRLVAMNVHSHNQKADEIIRGTMQIDADVVVFVESSWELIRAVPQHEPLLERYPHRVGLGTDMSGQIIVLSKFAMSTRSDGTGAEGLASSWGYRSGFLDVAGTPIRFAAVHAPSPRTKATWGYGRMTFDRLATYFDRINSSIDDGDIPTVFAGDLNGTPTSSRSLHVSERYGLHRAKPLAAWDGTFPSALPWFARSSIDGAFVSTQVRVHGWRTVPLPGSDHRGVVLEISVPSRGGS